MPWNHVCSKPIEGVSGTRWQSRKEKDDCLACGERGVGKCPSFYDAHTDGIGILFEDYDRKVLQAFNEPSDWNLLWFSIVILIGLGALLYRYAKRMDERISRKQVELENEMRRQLTQNISHELKTPVSSILGYMDTILDNPNIPEVHYNRGIARIQSGNTQEGIQDLSRAGELGIYAKNTNQ